MANSKIYLGNTNIGSLFQGADNISIYLGDEKVYPLGEPALKWLATYSDSHTESAECDSSSAITQNEINLSNLVSVEIGDCVTSIGYNAFYDCTGLTSIVIPNSVTSIGGSAFSSCSGLTSIDIPDSVTRIGSWAFTSCSGLTSVEIPNSVTVINGYTFSYCSSLTSCTIGSGVTSIGSGAFSSCSGLTSIDIPDSVTSIDYEAFRYCSSLTSCTIGSGVTGIGHEAFYNCSGLTSITVNATTPPTLGSSAFNYTNDCPIYVPCESVEVYKAASSWSDYANRIACKLKFKAKYSGGEAYEKVCDSSSLITTSVTKPTGYQYTAMTEAIIGDCVSTVAMNAFSGFTSLSSVTISDNVTSLANQVFKDCISLTEVKLPSGINKILDSTFENCTSLKNIDIPTGVTMIGGFENCSALESITLPNALSEIYGEAFKGCTSLINISIPSGVTRIGDSAFANCQSLTSITVNATTPPELGSSAFNGSTCPIYVPSASVEAYKTSSWWSTYASRIQAIP